MGRTRDSAYTAYLALGSNLGNPLENLRGGAKRLQSIGITPLVLSATWTTTPIDCPPDASPFANATLAITVLTSTTPRTLLAHCQAIERDLGRKPKKLRNESRPLDIDIITYADRVESSPELVLPHPRARHRFFVLAPLNEIAPNLVLPGHEHSVKEYLADCPEDTAAKRLDDFVWDL
ncbi:MAG: 2-amino-4-hydroxy-6-hydroxymethyldihydropteridine pyrophosphokinase [Verrucomicrobia subdivision 3 bacterium]|nr:2-amino-4-hydroxy-6-hydroxymethyldihydropteridine pyrophosphokinase [Limisphaerales bacterium]MCS1412808.1 2-amino-4-hydroxy-6-hydroxymethyldihydropteridine pyrophosphokinase [Limisphaerales bacterium]